METFSALQAICAGNSPVPGELPAQRPVTRSFDVFFDLHPNKRLSKQWWGWWFETLSHPLWRHRNGLMQSTVCKAVNVFTCFCAEVINGWILPSFPMEITAWIATNFKFDLCSLWAVLRPTLVGAKALTESMLTYFKSDQYEQTSGKFESNTIFQ